MFVTDSQKLTAAIDRTGDTYREIGKMYEEQPMKDILPLMDSLGEYKGILQTFPDVLKVHEVHLSFSYYFMYQLIHTVCHQHTSSQSCVCCVHCKR